MEECLLMDKQSIVHITGAGYVNKINLTNENGVIKGTLSIRLSDNNIVVFDVYESQLTSTGKENFKFKVFQTVMNEYVDSTQVDDYTLATKVFIGENKKYPQFPNATINVNIYESEDTIQIRTKNSLKLLNRLKDNQEIYLSMRFKIEGFIVEELVPEYTESGLETGRGILRGYIVDYNGIARPLELKVVEQGFKAVQGTWKKFDTLNLLGNVVNYSVEQEPTIPENTPGSFTTTDNTRYEYIKEYVVTDADMTYDSFTKEECQQATDKLEELKQELLTPVDTNTYDDDEIPF